MRNLNVKLPTEGYRQESFKKIGETTTEGHERQITRQHLLKELDNNKNYLLFLVRFRGGKYNTKDEK